jgi:hypothetical protein
LQGEVVRAVVESIERRKLFWETRSDYLEYVFRADEVFQTVLAHVTQSDTFG